MTAAAMAFPWAQRQAYLDPLLAIKCNQSWGADMVICEFALRIIDGIQLIKLLRQQNRNIAPVLLERDGRHSRDADNLDIQEIYKRKDQVVAQLCSGVEYLFSANKIELIHGTAVITAPHAVCVQTGDETLELKASNILIATGSIPARPPIEGLNLEGVITSDELIEQSRPVPQRLVIIGGGVIGLEFATVFRSLGSEVTIIEALDRILPMIDSEITQTLVKILKKRGIAVHQASPVKKVQRLDDGTLGCCYTEQEKECEVQADIILASIGRKANFTGLWEKSVGIQTARGIVVNERFETSVPGIYAIGDVVDGGIQLAHAASAEGCAAVAYMTGEQVTTDLINVPSCIYTNPEIACVGLTDEQAKAKGFEVKIGKFNMGGNGKSIISGAEKGFIKLVFDAQTDRLLGAQLICERATDLISELAMAIVNQTTLSEMASVVHPHPTFAEGIGEAIEDAVVRRSGERHPAYDCRWTAGA